MRTAKTPYDDKPVWRVVELEGLGLSEYETLGMAEESPANRSTRKAAFWRAVGYVKRVEQEVERTGNNDDCPIHKEFDPTYPAWTVQTSATLVNDETGENAYEEILYQGEVTGPAWTVMNDSPLLNAASLRDEEPSLRGEEPTP